MNSPVTKAQRSAQSVSPTYRVINRLLGGRSVIRKQILGSTDAHLWIMKGVPTRAMESLLEEMPRLPTVSVLDVVGISQRNWQRRREAAAADPGATLSVEEGNRLWRFAEVLALATTVLGSAEAAEDWVTRSQIGLDGQRPLELLTTAPGAQLVEDLLQRMEFGVYA